jgi:hypothetical protein
MTDARTNVALDAVLVPRPGVAFGTYEDFFLTYCAVTLTLDDLLQRKPLVARCLVRYPMGRLIVVVDTRNGATLPDAVARREAKREFEARRDNIRSLAYVLIGDGVMTTLARTTLRAMYFIRRDVGDLPMSFFGSVAEAAQWSLGFGSGVGRAQLVEAVELLIRAAEP